LALPVSEVKVKGWGVGRVVFDDRRDGDCAVFAVGYMHIGMRLADCALEEATGNFGVGSLAAVEECLLKGGMIAAPPLKGPHSLGNQFR
jgi:hypothetical protein